VSKSSAAEAKYLDVIRKWMAEVSIQMRLNGGKAYDPNHAHRAAACVFGLNRFSPGGFMTIGMNERRAA